MNIIFQIYETEGTHPGNMCNMLDHIYKHKVVVNHSARICICIARVWSVQFLSVYYNVLNDYGIINHDYIGFSAFLGLQFGFSAFLGLQFGFSAFLGLQFGFSAFLAAEIVLWNLLIK